MWSGKNKVSVEERDVMAWRSGSSTAGRNSGSRVVSKVRSGYSRRAGGFGTQGRWQRCGNLQSSEIPEPRPETSTDGTMPMEMVQVVTMGLHRYSDGDGTVILHRQLSG
jgi:hypothetical protein